MKMKPSLYEKHKNCPVEVIRTNPWHLGLYCKPHGKWLKWLNNEESDKLIYLLNIDASDKATDEYVFPSKR